MKKWIHQILLIVLLFSCIAPDVYSEEAGTGSTPALPKTPAEVLKNINNDMKELYGLPSYYPEKTPKGNLREDLLQKHLKNNTNNFEMVYGQSHDKLEFVDMYRYSGFSVDGDPVATEGAPWDAGWSGTQIQNFNMVREPWDNDKVQAKYNIYKNRFDNYVDSKKRNEYLVNSGGTFEQAIIAGLNYHYAGQKYAKFIYNNQDAQYKDRVVYTRDGAPKSGKWVDYVHVLQPPTYLSWGSGRIYIEGSRGITYLGIPIAPFILQVNDLSPHFENLASGAVPGQQVRVGVRLRSSFAVEKTTDFSWKISTSSGKDISVKYEGHAASASGNISLQGNRADNILYATFTMPEDDVNIKFNLNTGKNPKENVYANNEIKTTVKLVSALPTAKGQFDLDYNVLTKKVDFKLANGVDIKALLSLPDSQSRWNGNATGALNVINQSEGIYRYFRVEKNPAVNEAATTIVRNPEIVASLQRKDFGDDPQNKKWYDNKTPYEPVVKSGNISFAGNVSRPYIKEYEVCSTSTDLEGKPVTNCTTRTENGTVTAPFTPGQDTRTIRTFIYNGMDKIPPKEYDNKIDSNETNSLLRKLFWTSEPYNFNVIRWMAHEDEQGKLDDWTAVNGKYQRTFTQQASGAIGWKAEKTMAAAYKKARDTARKMVNSKSAYDTAVFATDRQLQNYDYPIKSGYYFNPSGVYTFTLETVTYKDKLPKNKTEDHMELLDNLIHSFRYETDLMYINNKKVAVNLRNEPLAKSGNRYVRKPAALTAKDNKGVNAAELLTVETIDFTKNAVEIYHAQDRENEEVTHPYWKNILEGYSQSSTVGSFKNFKYREYVGLGQHMYKIEEKSKISININKGNIPVYTTADMPDGNYYVKAWLADVELSGSSNAYKRLGKLVGIKPLDQITVTVKGSMFDDLNN